MLIASAFSLILGFSRKYADVLIDSRMVYLEISSDRT